MKQHSTHLMVTWMMTESYRVQEEMVWGDLMVITGMGRYQEEVNHKSLGRYLGTRTTKLLGATMGKQTHSAEPVPVQQFLRTWLS